MHLLNYPHVDAALTSYISLHRAPFSSSLVSPHFPRSPWCRWCKYAAMYIRAKNRASTALSHVIPVSFPPLRTYATISLLPSHQEPRHRMYFYDGDAPWISSANESVQRDIFRYLEIKSPFEILYWLLYVANIFSRCIIYRVHSRYRIIQIFYLN